MVLTFEGCNGDGLRETVEAQVFVDVTHKLVVTFSNESETYTQTGQTVELRQCARNNQVAELVHKRSDIVSIGRNETGVSLVDEHDGVRRNILHNLGNLTGGQTVTRGVIGRCQQQHTGIQTVGIFDDLVDVVGEGVARLMQRIHLESAAALTGDAVVVPPREFRNQDVLAIAVHQEIVHGILQDILTTVAQQHLLLGHTVDFTHSHGDHALLALIVDTGIKTEIERIETLHGVNHLLTRLKVEFISV